MLRGKGPVYRLERGDKALMIDAVLTSHAGGPITGRRILDIGCGNGDISAHFGRANEVHGVDVEDKRRRGNRAFPFVLVSSERLPFADAFFDIVLSNHVIEHVEDQRLHLDEVRRVLKPGGMAYLATPNKSSPIMPGHRGNERVLRYRQMQPLFERSAFRVHEYSLDLVRNSRAFGSGVPGLGWIPVAALRPLRPFFPSHVFVLEPASSAPVSPAMAP